MPLSDEIRALIAARNQEQSLSERIRAEIDSRGSHQPRGQRGGRNNPRSVRTDDGEPNSLGVFLGRLGERTMDAVLAAPSASGDMLAGGAALAEGLGAAVVPGGRGADFRQRFRAQQELFPANMIRAIPRFTTDDVIAGGRAAMAAVPGGVSPGEQFQFSQEGAARGESEINERYPIATGAGEFGGNVAAMLLTRQPLQGGIRRLEGWLMRGTRGADDAAEAAGGVTGLIDDILTSKAGRLPIRGLFRASEAGLEGAWLEALSEAENDPMLAAALAGGTQTASSVVSTLGEQLEKRVPGGKLGSALLAVGTGAVALQMLKEATPGGRDRVLESIETSTEKVVAALVLTTLAQVAGGRGRDSTGALAKNLPDFVEGARTIPRTAIQTTLNNWLAAPASEQEQIEVALDRLMEDPSWKGDTELEREVVNTLLGDLEIENETRQTSRGTRQVR